MAKHPITIPPAVAEWALAIADTIVTAEGFKVRLGDLPVAGAVYAFHNGIKQSLADAKAGIESGSTSVPEVAKAAAAGDEKAKAKWAKMAADIGLKGADAANPDDVESVTSTTVRARQTKRFDAIMAGTMVVREDGGRLSPRDAWINKAAEEEMRAVAERKGATLPKGAEFVTLRGRYIAAKADHFAKLWDERNARLAAVADAADDLIG